MADTTQPDPTDAKDPNSIGATYRRLGPVAHLAALWAFTPAIAGFILIGFMGPVSEWLVGLGDAGIAVYVGAFVITAGLGVLPTYAQALLAGYAFGVVPGFLAALAGFTGASIVGGFIARRLGAERVERETQRHPKIRAVRDALLRNDPFRTLGIITLVRIPPNSPFALTNLVLSTARVPWPIYIIGTAVGMAPRTLAVVMIGSQITDWSAGKPKWFIIGGIVLTLVVVLIVGKIATVALNALTSAEQSADRPVGSTDQSRSEQPAPDSN